MIYIWLCDYKRSGALDCVNIISNSIFQAFIPFWTSFEVLQFVFQVEQFRRSVFWFPFVCALFLSSYHLLHHLYLKEIIFIKYKQNCARNIKTWIVMMPIKKSHLPSCLIGGSPPDACRWRGWYGRERDWRCLVKSESITECNDFRLWFTFL